MLAALDRIERRLADFQPAAASGNPEDQAALADIQAKVRATQMEIAALRHPQAEQDRLVVAGEELAAVVKATETATNSVLAEAERIDRAAALIHQAGGEQAEQAALIQEAVIRIFEACNFQDITGQRVAKIVRTLSFVEERVAAMVETWGAAAFENLPRPQEVDSDEEAKLLNGPQLEGKAISQAEIDALFA